MRKFITGNQAVVQAALHAGCDYFAGYPITPASSILAEFVRAFSDGRGVAMETEDEIAAIGQCIGAAMAGAKAMTATSGPGLSLYSENIGLAQMGEVPLVIVDCQRMGPATGGATSTGDGDVVFARHVTSGSYPIPVLAATDAASAYLLTLEAFNIADTLRTPIILLSSKQIALTRQTVDFAVLAPVARVVRRLADPAEHFDSYRFDELEDIPAFSPIGGTARVRFTGSIHDEQGLLTISPPKMERTLEHLRRKITSRRRDLEIVDTDLDSEAKVLFVSYGVADGATREAVQLLRAQGRRVSRLTIYSLWPIPETALLSALGENVRRVVVPELNLGLYAEQLGRFLGDVCVDSVTRIDGGLIHPETLLERAIGASQAST